MNKILVIITLFSSVFCAKAQQTDAITILPASEFNEAIASKEVQLVDVRTVEEFKEGAIDNALNIDFFQQENFKTQFEKLDKDKPVYLYCRSGHRSHKAAVKLEAMGFSTIFDLEGGYMNWPFKN